ncbi:hypothetical protein KFE98_02985 [bacterium SCSIO 12741]|nr:hypothetical protein KFE98_02985 [bacterium SCSIO 12741]
MKIKHLLGAALVLGLGVEAMAQTNGVGVQYNNTPTTFNLPNNAVGVMKLTHRGAPPGSISQLPPPLFNSPENVILDWTPGLGTDYRFNRIVFRDIDNGNINGTQTTMVGYGSSYNNPSYPNRSNDLGFHSYVSGGQDFFFDNFKVGINTHTPSAYLHIFGHGQGIKLESNNNANPNSQAMDIVFTNPSTPGTQRDWVIRSTGPNHTTHPNYLEFWSPEHTNSRVYFANTKVGIGTTKMGSGPYKLFVAGGIRTEEVKVDLASTWPDYVFEEEYELKDLSEVKEFIEENHHLPNVPSAAEMEDGIELGEMVRLQMEKIEELTMYLIELEEKNAALEEKVEGLMNKSSTSGQE